MKSKSFAVTLFTLFAFVIPTNLDAQNLPPAVTDSEESTSHNAQLVGGYGRLPLSFEANEGQTDSQVRFISRGASQMLFLTSADAVLVLGGTAKQTTFPRKRAGTPALSSSLNTVVRMTLLGANQNGEVTGLEPLPGSSNYFIGNDPAKWRTGVPTYRKVRYKGIYPGVDLVYYGNQQQLEYDFVIAPGADPRRVALAVQGAKKISIDVEGNALLHYKNGDIHLQKPRIYQEMSGQQIEVAGGYKLKGHELRFAVANFDHHYPLVIDPVLSYSTYLGGSAGNYANAIAVDSFGDAYIAGVTTSSDFPTKNPVQPSIGGAFNVFIAKLNATGDQLLYSTYLGGNSNGGDLGNAIAVDSLGNAYVTGLASSASFPVTSGAFQTTFGGGQYHAFVTKLNSDGSALQYSTYLGGSGNDQGQGIAVDASQDAYVTGNTGSTNFPVTLGALQTSSNITTGQIRGFVTKLNAAGAKLVYSTYLGGSASEFTGAIAVDSLGNAYVTGGTNSTDFPITAGAYQKTNSGGSSDAFIAKLNPRVLHWFIRRISAGLT